MNKKKLCSYVVASIIFLLGLIIVNQPHLLNAGKHEFSLQATDQFLTRMHNSLNLKNHQTRKNTFSHKNLFEPSRVASTVYRPGEFALKSNSSFEYDPVGQFETGKPVVSLEWGSVTGSSGYQMQHTDNVEDFAEGAPDNDNLNISTNYGKRVSVLNVYPYYKNERGEKLPANFLKDWMKQDNGAGQPVDLGLITVEEIDLQSFKENPDKYLKDSSGKYKYNAIYYGSADSNGGADGIYDTTNDLGEKAYNATLEFGDTGRGVLMGHDTIYGHYPLTCRPYFSKLAVKLDFEISGIGYTGDYHNDGENKIGSRNIEISTVGGLTQYPNKLDPKTVYNVDYSHTLGQFIKYNSTTTRWMKYQAPLNSPSGKPIAQENYLYDANNNVIGDNNWYLATNLNYAMIQTGHTTASCSPQEAMLIANMIYYTCTLNTDLNGKDPLVVDDVAPKSPQISIDNRISPQQSSLTLSSQDVGKDYYYRVRSLVGSTNKYSDVIKQSVESDIQGYVYQIDNSPTANVTVNKNEQGKVTNTNFFKVNRDPAINPNQDEKITSTFSNNEGQYLHVVAVDRSGNVSEPTTQDLYSIWQLNLDTDDIYSIKSGTLEQYSNDKLQTLLLDKVNYQTIKGKNTLNNDIDYYQGNLYSYQDGTIYKIDTNGQIEPYITNIEANAYSVAINKNNGLMYILDPNYMYVYDLINKSYVDKLSLKGDFNRGDAVVDQDGYLWATGFDQTKKQTWLYKIRPSDAQVVSRLQLKGETPNAIGGMAFLKNSELVLSSKDNWYKVNMKTGVLTAITNGAASEDLASKHVPKLETNISTTSLTSQPANNAIVHRGDEITYTIKVTNSGSLAATDVKVQTAIPAGSSYVPNSTKLNLGTSEQTTLPDDSGQSPLVNGALINSPASLTGIIAGENKSATISFTVKVNENANDSQEIVNQNITIQDSMSNNNIAEKTVKHIVKAPKVVFDSPGFSNNTNPGDRLIIGDRLTVRYRVSNEQTFNPLFPIDRSVWEFKLPDGLEFDNSSNAHKPKVVAGYWGTGITVEINDIYDANTRKIVIDSDSDIFPPQKFNLENARYIWLELPLKVVADVNNAKDYLGSVHKVSWYANNETTPYAVSISDRELGVGPVTLSKLTLLAPEEIVFPTSYYLPDNGHKLIKRQEPDDWSINLFYDRANLTPNWSLRMKLEQPFKHVDDNSILRDDILFFRDRGVDTVMNGTETQIMTGDFASDSNNSRLLQWGNDEGPILKVNSNNVLNSGKYKSTVLWTITNSV